MPIRDDNGEYAWKEYRIVFPYDAEALAEGYWLVLDRRACEWKTVGWGLYGPGCDTEAALKSDSEDEGEDRRNGEDWNSIGDHDTAHDKRGEEEEEEEEEEKKGDKETAKSPQSAEDENTSNNSRGNAGSQATEDEAVDALASGFSHLSFQPSKEKEFFDSHCVTNNVMQVRKMLACSGDPKALIDSQVSTGLILIATCEVGHREVLIILLEYGASLEVKDEDGHTAIQKAISGGHGTIGLQLIEAGADIGGIDNDGQTLLYRAELALTKVKEAVRFNKQCLAYLLAKDHYEEGRVLRAQRRLSKLEMEVNALTKVLQHCETVELQKRAEAELRRIELLQGPEQSTYFKQHGALDHALIIRRILNRIYSTPRATEWKTVACLVRVTALPYRFAVSGYRTTFHDGALNRPKWIKKVFRLAKVMNRQLPAHQFDDEGQPGSYFACHAEKQLLAYFVWTHTSLCDVDKLDASEAILSSAPPSWSEFPIEIYLCQPGQHKAEVCSDCVEFCARAAEQFGLEIMVRGVNQTEAWTIASWP